MQHINQAREYLLLELKKKKISCFTFTRPSCSVFICFSECPHAAYDPDLDGYGFCWFLPAGQVYAQWNDATRLCETFDKTAYLIELDTAAKMNYFVNQSRVLDGVS